MRSVVYGKALRVNPIVTIVSVLAGASLLGILGALLAIPMRREGKLDLIGLSNVDRPVIERALDLVDVAEIQNAYSIINRHDDDLVAFAGAHRIAFVPFGPLGSAYLRGPTRLAVDATIGQVAEKHGATPAQIALAWLLAR